jgi:hypothetical protein
MLALPISSLHHQIGELCRRWRVSELSLFGSVVRPDFSPASDVDVLVRFAEGATWSFWDLLDMNDELSALFGREVDLVEQRNLANPFRRRAILREKQLIYAAE